METSVEENNTIPLALGRPKRDIRPPRHHGDYHVFHTTQEGKTLVNDDVLDIGDAPLNYKEAMASPEAAKWKEAMESEIQSMYDNQV